MIEELQTKILNAMENLAHANNEHRKAAEAHAQAEFDYRQARAKEFVEIGRRQDEANAKSDDKKAVEKRLTDTAKNALVDIATADQMFAVRIAEARHEFAWELVKCLKAQLSAGQSLLGAHRAEAEAIRFSQTMGA